ncbi:hypothetical protein FA15DRAFT_698571 [Coprinopsis marcescibilis]|uniref:Alcohol dehydrogenase-like C-terminal domain-containing protein n=1 Tax=Coprinopsis marcescibilis TaxID=230819 RepID=A0A5C3KBE5_COPMA|nr:hypothetical protein FA15DRAFT_698571 [Coprinopsis marcescibilis]
MLPERWLFQGLSSNATGEGTAGFQQFAKADALTTAKIPPKLTPAQAASVPVGLTTAYDGYIRRSRMAQGFSPIITTSSLKHEEFLKSLGATDVLDRSLSPDVIQAAVKRRIGDVPLKLVYDAIAVPETQHLVLPAAEQPEDNKTIIGAVALKTLPFHIKVLCELYTKLSGWLEDGSIKPNWVEKLPNGLSRIVEGLQRSEEDKVSGIKLVVLPLETVL